MTIWQFLSNFGISYTLMIVSLGAFIIGFISGILSVFFVLQKRSIIGDALAHSSLPGVAIAFLIVLEKNRYLMIAGAMITAFMALFMINILSNKTKLKSDTVIAITLSLFFAIGVAILTYIQKLSVSAQTGLEHYIFGNIAFLLKSDLYSIIFLSTLVIIPILLFYKEFKLLLFDRDFAKTLDINVKFLDILQMILTTLAIVLAIEMIGVVLIAGLLVGPAVAARQWTDKFAPLLIISGLISAISGVIGSITSSKVDNLPPGPIIIVILTGIIVLSLLFGPKSSFLGAWMHRNLFHRTVNHQKLLGEFLEQTTGLLESNALSVLEFDRDEYPGLTDDLLQKMMDCGFCKILTGSRCALTYKGIEETEKHMTEVKKR